MRDDLSRKGHEVFIDRTMRVGTHWPTEIERQLATSKAFILLLSDAATRSDMVAQELKRAYQISHQPSGMLRILPIYLEENLTLPYDWAAYLDRIQHHHWKPGEDLALAEAVHRAIAWEPQSVTDGDLRQYRTWLRERHQGLDLIGLAGGDMGRLDLDVVYVPLRISQRERPDEKEIHGKRRGEVPREQPLDDVQLEDVFAPPRAAARGIVIFGDPGAGKTTALRKLARLCLADQPALAGLAADTVPVFLRLRRLTADDLARPLEDFVQRELDEVSGGKLPENLGRRLWERGRLFLLCDGLDEIADDALRAQVCKKLEWTLAKEEHRALRAVVSSRYSGYGGDVKLGESFVMLDVRPLDAHQVRLLVRRWFNAARTAIRGYSEQDAQATAEKLIAALDSDDYGSQRLKVLVGSPLLLTLMCVVVLRGGEMPKRRVAFYDQCLRVLLGTWRRTQQERMPPVEVEIALALLRPLAFKLHAEQRQDDLSWVELIRFLGNRLRELEQSTSPFAVARWLHRDAGVLEEYAQQRYGFMHLGIQEYLAALHVATQGEPALDALCALACERWWREVVLLLVGLPDRHVFTPFMARLLRSERFLDSLDLVRACLLEAAEVDVQPFLALLEPDVDPERQAAGLRLLRGRSDAVIVEKARLLCQSPHRDVRALAEQIVDESVIRAVPADQSNYDAFIAYDPADRTAAEQLARALKKRGVRVWLDVGEVPDTPWQACLETIVQLPAAIALVGPQARHPWANRDLSACLAMFRDDGKPLIPVVLPGAQPPADFPENLGDQRPISFASGFSDHAMQLLEHTLRPAAAAHGLAMRGEPFTDPATGMRFLWIPGGRFQMGGTGYGAEKPIHWVRISPFWLGETPVTNAQYSVFLKTTGHQEPGLWRDRRFSAPDQPVVAVSWHDAMAFCRWLSETTKLVAALPSEAQWEFAARGDDGREYPWGNQKPDPKRACYDLDVQASPAPVGSYPEGGGPFGTLDQAGNVWEWCADVWDKIAYFERKGTNAIDPLVTAGDDETRALRGGSWLIPAEYLRAACRDGSWAARRDGSVGFRVAVAAIGR